MIPSKSHYDSLGAIVIQGKAELVVVNLDPRYPQALIEEMMGTGLRDTKLINCIELMLPIDRVMRRLVQGKPVGLFERRRTFRELEKLIASALNEANEHPSKHLLILAPSYIPRESIAEQVGQYAKADMVACTGSD